MGRNRIIDEHGNLVDLDNPVKISNTNEVLNLSAQLAEKTRLLAEMKENNDELMQVISDMESEIAKRDAIIAQYAGPQLVGEKEDESEEESEIEEGDAEEAEALEEGEEASEVESEGSDDKD